MALKRIKAPPRTAEQQAEERSVREHFADRPSIKTLIGRGEIDPDAVMTGAAEDALLRAIVALKRARESLGLSLGEVSRRTGIAPAALSRLEHGKNPNPTLETLSRYAAALGLRLDLRLAEADGRLTPS
jgi:ribosome-binding protein aMBF1 (putative translation factor)